MEQIKFTVKPDGIIMDADGFANGKCVTEKDEILKALNNAGVGATETTMKRKVETGCDGSLYMERSEVRR